MHLFLDKMPHAEQTGMRYSLYETDYTPAAAGPNCLTMVLTFVWFSGE